MTKFLSNAFLPLCIVVVGLSTCMGLVLGSDGLVRFGFVSAASPLPLPFYDFTGKQEIFAYRMVLRTIDVNGSVHETPMTISDLAGPHRKKIVVIAAISQQHTRPTASYNILRHAICHSPGTVFAGMRAADISSAEIQIYSYREPGDLVRSITFTCSV